MSNRTISIPCIEITQPIGTFYIGVMNAKDLIRIAYADVRRIEKRDVETYLGIERPLSPKRVDELQRYVNTIDATFPTGVILAIESQHAEYRGGRMYIADDDGVAKIIDGQHRIAGLEGFTGGTFQVNVVVFIDMDIEDQAMVFATINLAQTKVSKSLVYDLYEYTKLRSPTKTSHNIARLLNEKEGSPFRGRIKILGTATGALQPLTQAAFVESVLALISGDAKWALVDRDRAKRGKPLDRAPAGETRRVLRNMFIDEKDPEIARLLWNYFDAVRRRWPEAWERVGERGNVLPRTNGFKALMRFFADLYLTVGLPGDVVPAERFLDILNRMDLQDADFNTDSYPPGTTGESRLYRDLAERLDRLA